MEGGAEGVIPPETPSSTESEEWVADWLEELCPYYMFLGVSCDEFWHGDYTKLKYYVQAYELKREAKSQEMWLQGLYNFDAFSIALSNLHFDGKRHKVNRYRESPIRLLPLTKAEKREKAEQERQKVIDFFNNCEKKFKKSK